MGRILAGKGSYPRLQLVITNWQKWKFISSPAKGMSESCDYKGTFLHIFQYPFLKVKEESVLACSFVTRTIVPTEV
jgi:hypothetical protein